MVTMVTMVTMRMPTLTNRPRLASVRTEASCCRNSGARDASAGRPAQMDPGGAARPSRDLSRRTRGVCGKKSGEPAKDAHLLRRVCVGGDGRVTSCHWGAGHARVRVCVCVCVARVTRGERYLIKRLTCVYKAGFSQPLPSPSPRPAPRTAPAMRPGAPHGHAPARAGARADERACERDREAEGPRGGAVGRRRARASACAVCARVYVLYTRVPRALSPRSTHTKPRRNVYPPATQSHVTSSSR